LARPAIIDVKMHGLEGLTAAFLVAGDQTALIETGPKSSVDNVLAGLADHAIESLDWIIVTHIHLDHAGAAGTLARRFPDARVAVHPLGALHLIDPSKLWASAARIYGDEMDSLWGGIDPIDESRIHIVEDGDSIDLGGRRLRAVETPGHARHHHSLLDDSTGIVFVGDALGVRLQDVGIVRPATPPPEFHFEDAIHSIARIAELDAESAWLTHFGPADEGVSPQSIDEVCDAATASLIAWEEWVREGRATTTDPDEVTRHVRHRARNALEGTVSPEGLDRLEHTTSYRMNVSGYMRYLDKND
jgi:glyoxylase-like metal-dependent hydrolase (beta-lactamase superfamily II)